jgi:ABC-2 type transport system permease protein
VTNVAGRELRGLFVSPVAYGVLSLFSVLAGLFFIVTVAAFSEWLIRLQQFQAVDQLSQLNLNDHLIGQFFHSMSVVLLFLVPGITMGLFAAEKTNGTQELLLTSPLTIWDIVLGKFLAGALFVGLLVALLGLFPALLFVYGDPELGKTVAGLIPPRTAREGPRGHGGSRLLRGDDLELPPAHEGHGGVGAVALGGAS